MSSVGGSPVIVISPGDLNDVTQTPIVLPITNGGGFAIRLGLALSLAIQSLVTTGVVPLRPTADRGPAWTVALAMS